MVATPETGDRLTTSSIGHKRDLRRDNGRKLMVFGRCADRVSPRFLAYSEHVRDDHPGDAAQQGRGNGIAMSCLRRLTSQATAPSGTGGRLGRMSAGDGYLHRRLRRLLSEFIGTAGLTFILSGGAAILVKYGGRGLHPWQTSLVLSLAAALWLVAAIYFLGDISAHFNPALTLAFVLRKDMDWMTAGTYWIAQFAAAICGSLLARGFFGKAGDLAACMPQPGQSWPAVAFEAIITFGLILMVLNLVNGSKLNGPFIPVAVGAYILAWGAVGGPYEGASMNPARSIGPDIARGNLSTSWVYLVGPMVGAIIAVAAVQLLRGSAGTQEINAVIGVPGNRTTEFERLRSESRSGAPGVPVPVAPRLAGRRAAGPGLAGAGRVPVPAGRRAARAAARRAGGRPAGARLGTGPALDPGPGAALAARLFGACYTLRAMSFLPHRMGYSPQVPVHRAVERDEAAEWRAVTWAKVRG